MSCICAVEYTVATVNTARYQGMNERLRSISGQCTMNDVQLLWLVETVSSQLLHVVCKNQLTVNHNAET